MKHNVGLLLALITLTGCASTTNMGTMQSERKQLLLYPTADFNHQSALVYNNEVSKGRVVPSPMVDNIAQRLIAQTYNYRPDEAEWHWEVNTLENPAVNAFCAAGGKIVVYTGIINKLALREHELAAILAHEIAHALREHGRERASKQMLTRFGVGVATQGGGGEQIASLVAKLGLELPNSRQNETEADLIGLELMARAGFNPKAAVSVWRKMEKVKQSKLPGFLSTHPTNKNRIKDIQDALPGVMPLYRQAIAAQSKPCVSLKAC